jgi:hypothetical protein
MAEDRLRNDPSERAQPGCRGLGKVTFDDSLMIDCSEHLTTCMNFPSRLRVSFFSFPFLRERRGKRSESERERVCVENPKPGSTIFVRTKKIQLQMMTGFAEDTFAFSLFVFSDLEVGMRKGNGTWGNGNIVQTPGQLFFVRTKKIPTTGFAQEVFLPFSPFP